MRLKQILDWIDKGGHLLLDGWVAISFLDELVAHTKLDLVSLDLNEIPN